MPQLRRRWAGESSQEMIPYSLKAKCVSLLGRMTKREIYEQVFHPECDNWSYDSFCRKLRDWKHKAMADEETLACGTYPSFTAHAATVQVGSDGRITQAWIKQQQDTLDWLKIRNIVCKDAPKSDIIPTSVSGKTMLEIPLFDVHFGVADFDYYAETLSEILGLISNKQYDEINILIGQDVLHTNDMRGHTAKGTEVQKIDFVNAWGDSWRFFRAIIDKSLEHSPHVCLRYSKGNHDECTAWCLFKALQAVYPQCACDDSLKPRKCIYWRGCFIGFGHCEYTKNNGLLFQNFVLDFPQEFANAKVREIHAGHLHRESLDNGMMIRRLPSAVPADQWSQDNGYIGVNKRFMIFEWAENRLKTISYV